MCIIRVYLLLNWSVCSALWGHHISTDVFLCLPVCYNTPWVSCIVIPHTHTQSIGELQQWDKIEKKGSNLKQIIPSFSGEPVNKLVVFAYWILGMSVPMSVIVSFRCLNCFLLCWFSVCLSRCVNKLLACDCHPDEWYSVWESYSLYSALLLVLVPLLVLHYMSIWGAIWTGLLLVKRSSQFDHGWYSTASSPGISTDIPRWLHTGETKSHAHMPCAVHHSVAGSPIRLWSKLCTTGGEDLIWDSP